MPPLSIIVIGGGLGGLTSAIALQKAGHEVTVLEKYSFSGEVGAAVGLAPNVITYLQTLGFDIDRAKLCRSKDSQFLDGRSLKVTAVLPNPDSVGGTIFRPDLRDELKLLAEEAGCRMFEFASVATIDPDRGVVYLEDGTQRHGDLVVAADGVHSSAMDHVLGRPFLATPTDFTAMRAVVSTERLRQSPCAGILAPAPGRATFSISPRGGGYLLCYWCHAFEYVNVVLYRYGVEDDPAVLAATDGGRRMRGQTTRAHVAAALAQFHPDLGTLSDHLLDVLPLWRLFTRPSAPRYSRGRLVAIGDAAHAMLSNLGQGANASILDAAALGTLFADVPDGGSADDIARRLRLYDDIRSPRVSATQIWSERPMFEKRASRRNDQVRKVLPNVVDLPETNQEILDWLQQYDVVQDCRDRLRENGLG